MFASFLGDLPDEPRLQWSLTAVGLLVLLVGFLPGGWRLTAWIGNLQSWHRVGLFFIGVGLLAVAWLRPPSDGPTLPPINPPPADESAIPEPVAVEPVEPVEVVREDPSLRLVGLVRLGHNEPAFGSIYDNYRMTVDTTTGRITSELKRTGQFSLNISRADATDLTVSWQWERPSDFVIWPLEQPVNDSLGQLEFHFDRLSDVFLSEKKAMIEQVVVGKFDAAHDRLDTLKKLLIRVEEGQDLARDSRLIGQVRRWTYAIHRDLAKRAGEYRGPPGVTQVDNATWMKEREWLRAAITAATKQTTADAGGDLAHAMNNWATFSRQVYRPGGEAWPDRKMAACPDRLLLREAVYCDYLREDIELVLSSLRSNEGQTLLAGIRDTQASLLSSRELRAVRIVQRRSDDLAVDEVKLHHLALVLNALNKFVKANEQTTAELGEVAGTEGAGKVS